MSNAPLTIIGGTYLEICDNPTYHELYGSGLRAAAALSGVVAKINYISCIGKKEEKNAKSICDTFGIASFFTIQKDTAIFHYYHPLSKPTIFEVDTYDQKISLTDIAVENMLYYGMIEATVKVNAKYMVYDPQNHVSFSDTGSTVEHLALILNKKEALLLSKLEEGTPLEDVGIFLLSNQHAEAVVIKDGSNGALAIDKSGVREIPVYKTSSVWPIGSGDIFSAVFAWQWIVEKKSPFDSAILSSQYTANYCQTQLLPLNNEIDTLEALPISTKMKNVYLAGPFFTLAEKWLINEIRSILLDFGNHVFSPMHDVGVLHENDIITNAKEIATRDLEGLKDADVLLAVFDGKDVGTLFEIGYAKALNKKVIILAENIHENDLTMLIGTGCEITKDLTSAIYMASW